MLQVALISYSVSKHTHAHMVLHTPNSLWTDISGNECEKPKNTVNQSFYTGDSLKENTE